MAKRGSETLMRTNSFTRVPSARFTRHLALSSGLLSTAAGRRFSTEASTDASSTPKLLSVNKSTDGDYAYLTMSSPPVNAISSAMATEITQTNADHDSDSSVRGFVLGSSVPGIFSAGLQLDELLIGEDGDTGPLARYWTSVQEMWLALYTTRLATVAAIPGHCIAGGCILALACDVRVMVDGGKGRFGVNETTFGLVPPPWLTQMMVDAAGLKAAAPLVQRGLLLPAEEALAAGLVDQTASLSRLAEESSARLNELLAVPDHARAQVKHQLRHTLADTLQYDGGRSDDLDLFMDLATSTDVQVQLKSYLKSLKKK